MKKCTPKAMPCKFNLKGICGNNECKQFCFTCITTRRCKEYELDEEKLKEAKKDE